MSASLMSPAPIVTRQGDAYRITSVEYLGERASCTNGPLWQIDATRVRDSHPVHWHESTTPLGAWDESTRGFWEGGRRVTVSELRPGDVFRWRTYSGYFVATVKRVPEWSGVWPAYVELTTTSGSVHMLGPDESVELANRP